MEVADTGAGMDATIRARIFEPFFTTKEMGKGTGLGLATVYGIVQQSGGYIAVESETQQGSRFTVYLPSTEEEAAVSAAVAKCNGDPVLTTVLLVEDVHDVLNSLRELLQSKGYEVLCAENGKSAMEILHTHTRNIDLLVTDIVMPNMSGDDLAEAARTIRPKMKILFMSGGTLKLVSEVKNA